MESKTTASESTPVTATSKCSPTKICQKLTTQKCFSPERCCKVSYLKRTVPAKISSSDLPGYLNNSHTEVMTAKSPDSREEKRVRVRLAPSRGVAAYSDQHPACKEHNVPASQSNFASARIEVPENLQVFLISERPSLNSAASPIQQAKSLFQSPRHAKKLNKRDATDTNVGNLSKPMQR